MNKVSVFAPIGEFCLYIFFEQCIKCLLDDASQLQKVNLQMLSVVFDMISYRNI